MDIPAGYVRKVVSVNKLVKDFKSQSKEELEVWAVYGKKGPILTPEMLSFLAGALGIEGEPLIGDAADRGPGTDVVEASAAAMAANIVSILTDITKVKRLAYLAAHPTFKPVDPANTAEAQDAQSTIMAKTLTATAGGEITTADVVPSMAGRKTCMLLTHIFSDQTDAAAILTFATASGLSEGPSPITVETKADEVFPDYCKGLFYRGSANAEAITLTVGAGQLGNAQELTFFGDFWYE